MRGNLKKNTKSWKHWKGMKRKGLFSFSFHLVFSFWNSKFAKLVNFKYFFFHFYNCSIQEPPNLMIKTLATEPKTFFANFCIAV